MMCLENTQENYADFCREVARLLCRSFAFTHEKFCSPTSGRFSRLHSTWQNGRVVLGFLTTHVLIFVSICLLSHIL